MINFAHFGMREVNKKKTAAREKSNPSEFLIRVNFHVSHKIFPMTQNDVIQVFRDSGALLEGHFILRSGLHSRQFFQCALALQSMPVVEKLGAALAAKVKPLGAVTVVAPAMGGL